MPVETDFYNKLATPPTPPNLLGLATSAVGIANASNQNRLFQQEFAGKQAIGQAWQQSIDPQTGRPDPDAFLANVAKNPASAFLTGEAVKQDVERRSGLATLSNTTLENFDKTYGMVLDAATSVYGNPNAKRSDVESAIATVAQATPDKDTRANIVRAGLSLLQGIPEDATPDQIKQRLIPLMMQTKDAKDKVAMALGAPQMLDTGGGILPVASSSLTGTTRAIGPLLGKSLTPGETQALVDVVGPDGTHYKVPRGILPMAGGGGGGIAPAAQPAPVAPGTPPTPVAPAGATLSGLSPSQETYRHGLGENAVQYEKALNEGVNTWRNTAQALEESKKALEATQAGGGAQSREVLARGAQAFGMPKELVDKIAGGDLGAAQEFQKLAVNNATQVMRQLLEGGGRFTNLEFQKFQDSNPNLSTDPRAIEKMYNFMSQMGKLAYKEQDALARYKKAGGDVTEFPAWWEKTLLDSGVIKLNSELNRIKQ